MPCLKLRARGLGRSGGCFEFKTALCEVDRQNLQKKWVFPTHAIHLAAGLPEHQHAPRTQVGHRVAGCARLARPRVPTSTTSTLSAVLCSSAAQKLAAWR